MYSIIFLTLVLSIIFIFLGSKVKQLKPFEKPKGIGHVAVEMVSSLHQVVIGNMGTQGQGYVAYVSVIFIYILVSNMSGLIGLPAPTGNLSVTLSFAIISWLLFQRQKIKTNGIVGYFKSFFEPFFLFFIPNIFGAIAPLISMSLRLFGNVTAGIIIMQLVYGLTGWISQILPFGLSNINVFSWLIAPPLHFYFDVFSSILQAFIFISLTTILTSVEFPKEN